MSEFLKDLVLTLVIVSQIVIPILIYRHVQAIQDKMEQKANEMKQIQIQTNKHLNDMTQIQIQTNMLLNDIRNKLNEK